MVDVIRRDSTELSFLLPWVERLDEGIDAWVRVALDDNPPAVQRIVRALVDHRTWTAFSEQGAEDVPGAVSSLAKSAWPPAGDEWFPARPPKNAAVAARPRR